MSARSVFGPLDANKKAATPGAQRRKSGVGVGLAGVGDKGGARRATLALRRQTLAPMSAVPSASQLRRASGMPQSGSKTPTGMGKAGQRRSLGRQSMAPRQRAFVDPRAVKGKEYVQESAQRLADYLEANDYPHKHVTVDDLRKPSSKDFYLMFEFLFCQIDPSWKLPDNAADELPHVIKALGYPFVISKSNLISSGAPHTWPHLLALLSWLRELLEYDELATHEDEADKDFHMFFDFATRSYQLFLQAGECDELAALEEEADAQLLARTADMRDSLERKDKERAALQAEIDKLRRDPRRPAALRRDLTMLDSDLGKFGKLVGDLQKHETSSDHKHSAMEERKASMLRDLQAVKGECVRYQAQIKEQSSRDIDAEQMHLAHRTLTKSLSDARTRRHELLNKIYGLEMELSESWHKCEEAVDVYTGACKALRILPPGQPNGNNFDFTLAIHPSADKLPHLSRDIKKEIVPALQAQVSMLRGREMDVWNHVLSYQTARDNLHETLSKLGHECEQLALEFHTLDNMRMERKSRLDDELHVQRERAMKLMKEIDHKKRGMLASHSKLDYELGAQIREQEELQAECIVLHKEQVEDALAALSHLSDYKNYVQSKLAEYKAYLLRVLETTAVQVGM